MIRIAGRRFEPGLWATVFALPLFLVLVGLGVWQLQRLEWKLDLIADIEARAFGRPVTLPKEGIDPEDWRYQRVTVTGTFDHSREVHLVANKGAGYMGYEVITPLERSDGSWVLIDRGWVPSDKKNSDVRPEGQRRGTQAIVGLVRLSRERPWAVPANRPAENIWFYANIPEIAAHLGLNEVAPVFVQADKTPNPGGWPRGGQTDLDLPNRHLGYALTWFGLALTLACIYVIYHLRPDDDA